MSSQLTVEDGQDYKDEVVVPVAMWTFINKEVNFELFLEILTEKIEKQRVSLQLK